MTADATTVLTNLLALPEGERFAVLEAGWASVGTDGSADSADFDPTRDPAFAAMIRDRLAAADAGDSRDGPAVLAQARARLESRRAATTA